MSAAVIVVPLPSLPVQRENTTQRDEATNTFLPGVQVFPTGGVPVIAGANALNALEDADLGQTTGLGIGFKNGVQAAPGILVVDGGPI